MLKIDRRSLVKYSLAASVGLLFNITPKTWAKTYMTEEQARLAIWNNLSMSPNPIELTKEQKKTIKKASKIRVRADHINAWRVENGGWFILDQVIGKHENIDIAVGITPEGKIAGIEILEYRETYGHEVANPKWRAQFTGKNSEVHLKLDDQIQNISGATLSCRHITDGINRLTHTWNIVLRDL